MTRLDRVIKGFNDYDNLVKEHIEDGLLPVDDVDILNKLHKIRSEVSLLIGELKRFGCRREN